MYYVYVDEAGRWPLAWPIYIGIIVEEVKNKKPKTQSTNGLFPALEPFNHKSLYKKYRWYDDSKVLSETIRENLYEKIIHDKNLVYASWSSNSTEIDKHGIVRWTRTSIARAIHKLFIKDQGLKIKEQRYSEKEFLIRIKKHACEIVLVIDGKTDFWIKKLRWVSVETIVDGDAIVPMISAASIVAKVERDREMKKIDKKYPHYGFARHKWYGTKAHYEAIEKHGISKFHRKSFLTKVLEKEPD